jgi:type I restriction enzyme S subunit
MSAQELITDHLDLWTEATATKSNSGRGNSGKTELVGIQKLRELILELATKGKLTIQNPQTESANELMAEVQSIRRGLEDAGKIKKQKGIPPIEHEKLTFSVPKNWTWVRLAELTEKIGSGATPRGGKSAYVTNGVPFFRSQNIWNDGLNLTDVAYIPEETHRKMANTHVYPDDILLNITGASLGRTTIVPSEIEEANVSQHVTIIRIIPPVSIEFIHYLLLSPYVQAMVWGRQVGMAREGLSKKVLELFELPLPPLDEQQRIVQKVDELMVLCDRLEQQTSDQIAAHATLVDTLLSTLTQSQNATELAENWTRLAAHFDTIFTTEQSIDKLKKTILQLAVMGALAETATKTAISGKPEKLSAKRCGKSSDKNQSTPLREASKIDKSFSIPAAWRWEKIEDLVDPDKGISYGIIKLGKEPKSGGVPTLRCSDVKPRKLDTSGIRTVSEEIEEPYRRTRLEGGEVLLNIRGTLGGVALAPSNLKGFNVAREVAVIPPGPTIYGPFLVNLIASPFFWEMIESNLKGIAYKGLNLKTLRSLRVPVPPLNVQKEVVKKTEELISICDQLEACILKASDTRGLLANTVVESALV